jgi:hypothetical protein
MPAMNFTVEDEVDKNISFDINRKPTSTDTTIPYDSYHSLEQQLAAVRYMKNRNETHSE